MYICMYIYIYIYLGGEMVVRFPCSAQNLLLNFSLRLIYQFWEHLIWAPKFKEGRKRETNVFYRNKKLYSVTFFSKLNIETEHINR